MKRVLVLALFAVLLTACAEEVGAIDMTPANNGESILTNENQAIHITLDSNPTTGFKWNLVTPPDDKVLKFVSSDYVPDKTGSTSRVGAGGHEVWAFTTTGRGTTSLSLAYFRPFDPTQITQVFSTTIIVQ
ncbi:MAG: protease inhibitor I42 family protein [Chloroflexi bacterium]|nr:protease inhibitor I42 family protein [Chloroflexota bacterium]